MAKINGDPETILFVDGTCFNDPKCSRAYARVTDNEGNDMVTKHRGLFSELTLQLENVKCPVGEPLAALCIFDDVKSQQNNGAELVAMWMGLKIALSQKSKVKKICSDSELIVCYWSVGHVSKKRKRKKTKQQMDPRKKKFIEECAEMRKKFEGAGGVIEQIDGKLNKSDYFIDLQGLSTDRGQAILAITVHE